MITYGPKKLREIQENERFQTDVIPNLVSAAKLSQTNRTQNQQDQYHQDTIEERRRADQAREREHQTRLSESGQEWALAHGAQDLPEPISAPEIGSTIPSKMLVPKGSRITSIPGMPGEQARNVYLPPTNRELDPVTRKLLADAGYEVPKGPLPPEVHKGYIEYGQKLIAANQKQPRTSSPDQQLLDAAVRQIGSKAKVNFDPNDARPLLEQLPVELQPQAVKLHEQLKKTPDEAAAALHQLASDMHRESLDLSKQRDRETQASKISAPHRKALTDADTQIEKIDEARVMVNGPAESQALGIPKVLTALVSGQGSGVRITQAELNAIARARGVAGDIEGFFNKISGKGALTKEQQAQLTGILDDVKAKISRKRAVANDALDNIGTASSYEEMMKHDKAARKSLSEISTGLAERSDIPDAIASGIAEGQTRSVNTPQGMVKLRKKGGKIYQVVE